MATKTEDFRGKSEDQLKDDLIAEEGAVQPALPACLGSAGVDCPRAHRSS
jgi:hypothetical protein